METNIKTWYTKNFPHDDYAGKYLHPEATFEGLMNALDSGIDIYTYIFINGHSDSLIRENIFGGLSDISGVDYDTIYDNWLNAEQV